MNDCGAADGLLWGLNLRWLYILMEVFLMHAFEFDGTVERGVDDGWVGWGWIVEGWKFFLRLGWRGCCLGLWVFYVVVQVGGLWILFWV